MSKPSIAICLTGQMRSFREQEQRFYKQMETLFGDTDYDLYGHTWSDQELPNHEDKFTNISVTNQNDIWQRIAECNPFAAMIVTKQIKESPEFQSAINGTGDMYSLMKLVITGLYAQIVSTWECLNAIRVHGKQYDSYIKLRWDGGVQDMDEPGPWPKIDLWKQDLFRAIEKHKGIAQPMALLQQHNDGSRWIPDFMFNFNQSAYEKLISKNIFMCINEMGEQHRLNNHSHDLWEDYLTFNEIKFESMTAECVIGFNSGGPENSVTPKTNKKWGI